MYEFEFSSNKFRREEDTMTYDELRESLGLKVPSKDRAADKAKAEKASKKEAAKKMKKAAKKAAKKLEL